LLGYTSFHVTIIAVCESRLPRIMPPECRR
jgi:hypothetical protein